MRWWILIFLTGGSFAYSEPIRRAVNPEFLLQWTAELSGQCAQALETAAGCLRGLEKAIETVSGREGHLVFESEIGLTSRVAVTAAGDPIFRIPPLVYVEDTAEHTVLRSRQSVWNPKDFSHSERQVKSVYRAMALAWRMASSDWNSAFAWLNNQVANTETAKKVLVNLLNGQRKESESDPYSFVRVRRVNKHVLENRPMAVEYFQGKYFVSKVRPSSKADEAGILVGMQLKSVGETEVTPENVNAMLDKLVKDPTQSAHFVGIEGSQLSIPYWGKERPLPGTFSYVLPMKNGSVGVLEILSFNTLDVCHSVREQLINLRKENIRALIVDLRHNTGGMVEPVRCIGGLLFGEDRLMARMKSIATDIVLYELRSSAHPILAPMPMIVLVDWKTASSSEILAGAAQDLASAWLVGLRTFGKGIAQDVTPLYINGDLIDGIDQLRTTIRYEFASGVSPQISGLEPDLVVTSSVASVDGEANAVRFVDKFGEIFKGEEPLVTVDPERLRRLKRLKACVGRNVLVRKWRNNRQLARWFSDRQLRVAALAAECEIGRNWRAAEISANRL